MPEENNHHNHGHWGNHRGRRIWIVRTVYPSIITTLSNPGVQGDCYLRMQNLSFTYAQQAARMKQLTDDCIRATKSYLQAKLNYYANGNQFNLDQATARGQELQTLVAQKQQIADYLITLYNDMLNATC